MVDRSSNSRNHDIALLAIYVWSKLSQSIPTSLISWKSWVRFSLCVGVVSVFPRSSRFVSVRLLSTCKSLLWVSLQLFIPQILVLVHVCPLWSAPREWNKKLKRFAVYHLCWIPSFLNSLHHQTPCGPLHTFAWAKFPSFRLLRNPESSSSRCKAIFLPSPPNLRFSRASFVTRSRIS